MYKCNVCHESFPTRNRGKSHRKQRHGTLRCRCRRMFVYEKEMEQHREDMIKNAKFYRCPDCCLSFHSELEKQHHLRSFKHGCPENYSFEEPAERTKPKRHRLRRNKPGSGDHACHTCARKFAKSNSLLQHQKSLGHLAQNSGAREQVSVDSNKGYIAVNQRDMTVSRDRVDTTARKRYFDDFYERNVKVDKSDMTMSRNIVYTTLNKLMSNVRDQRGGTMFNPNVIKAGSVPINAKIGKADEFDTNIELNVIPTDIRQHGTVNFGYVTNDDTASLKVKRDLCSETKTIPKGYAAVKVEKGSVPNTLLHDNYIIPCKIKQDLFNKIETAKKDLSLSNVDISSKAHGPALTLTIHPDRYSGVKHDINVDITLSIKSDISVTDHGWPRPATKRAMDKELIDEVIKTGTHLVPKKDQMWSISNSKAERTLLSSIDAGNGCRKKIYKVMKKHVQTCKSQSLGGLPEISSHILKTQVLRSSEKHSSKEYWHENNRDTCLVDTMKEMELALLQGHLQDYFNPDLNILEGKSMSQLRSVASHLRAEYETFLRK